MKYLLLSLALILTGCSDNSSSIATLERLQKSTQENLQTCQSQLEFYRNQNSSSTNDSVEVEPEQPAEPSCEEYKHSTIYKDGKLLATCYRLEESACGISASDCTDNYTYSCLTNVKLGSETKKICN